MAKKGGDDAAAQQAAQARADEATRQATVRAGTERVNDIFGKNFTDDFYKKQVDAYSDYATPQLETQLADARKQLTFSLARSNLLNSSSRASQEGALETQAGTARQTIADNAVAAGNTVKSNVAASKADLINMLTSTGDVESAVSNATTRASSLSQPQQFSPLSGLFANVTAGLGAQSQAEKAAYYSGGAIKPAFNTGLFAPSGSVKVSS